MLKKSLLMFAWLSCAVSPAYADDAAVKKALESRVPEMKVESVTKAPFLGLYEAVVEGEVYYTDEQANYLVSGSVIDLRTKRDLSEERRRKLAAIDFKSLPLEWAFVRVKGDGSRKFALFTDPDCPFCKRIEQEFLNLDNVTIYTFLYPIDQLHPAAAQKARAVWCASDRAKVWTELMLRNVQPKAAKCDTPVEKIVAFSEKLKIFGTPTLFLSDGQRIPGMVPAAQLDQLLNSVERR